LPYGVVATSRRSSKAEKFFGSAGFGSTAAGLTVGSAIAAGGGASLMKGIGAADVAGAGLGIAVGAGPKLEKPVGCGCC